MEKYQEIFCNIPGEINKGYHVILTMGNPVKIPPRHIPAHYHAEVSQQIQTILEQGIITQQKPMDSPCDICTIKVGQGLNMY